MRSQPLRPTAGPWSEASKVVIRVMADAIARLSLANSYADAIIRNGGKFTKYPKPLLATLANGETKPIVTGYLQVDVEVLTPAGKVMLPQWHVDVMQGTTTENLLYLGQNEEAELGLKTYRDQLVEVAKRQEAKRLKTSGKKGATSTNVQIDGKARKVVFPSGEQPCFKCRLTKPTAMRTNVETAQADGRLFVGQDGWNLQKEVQYLFDPRADESYITTAAITNQEMKLEGKRGKVNVRAHDLEPSVAQFLGVAKPSYCHRVRSKVYLLPDDQMDTVKKLPILPHVILRVIDSPVTVVVLGRQEYRELLERRDEDLSFNDQPETSDAVIDNRLDAMLEAAKRAGMSKAGLKRARRMIQDRF